jgi:hypothetical protein
MMKLKKKYILEKGKKREKKHNYNESYYARRNKTLLVYIRYLIWALPHLRYIFFQ